MIKIKHFTALLFLLLWATPFLQAQDKIKNYNLKSGLSNYKVQSIFKDKHGFVWIGTQDGLNRFDGKNFLVYRNNPNNKQSISNGNIVDIQQNTDGLLWIGIDGGGVNILNPITNKIRQLFNQAKYKESKLIYVKHIYIDTKNIAWISTWGGLIRYDVNRNTYTVLKKTPNKNSIAGVDIKQVIEDKEGWLWIGTTEGLSYLNPTTMQVTNYCFSEDKTSLDNSIRCLLLDANNILWTGSENGIIRTYDKKRNLFKTQHLEKQNIPVTTINSFYQDKNNTLFIGTNSGIFTTQIKQGTTEYLIANANITAQNCNHIFKDEHNLLWFTTNNDGFYVVNFDKDIIKTIEVKNNHPNSKQARSIIGGTDHSIWFESYGNGIVNFNQHSQKTTYYLGNTLIKYSNIEAIFIDSKKNLWIGTFSDGLYQYNFTTQKLTQILKNIRITAFLEDEKQVVWIATSNGLRFYDIQKNQMVPNQSTYQLPQDLSTNYIFFLRYDSQKNIWASVMNKGVYLINKSSGTTKYYRYKKSPLIESYDFVCFEEDSNGNYYLGSRNGGIVKVAPDKKITSISTKNGIVSNHISALLSDGNLLWISTLHGISSVDQKKAMRVRNLDETDGVKGYEFYAGSSYKGANGWLYFGSNEGVNYFHPDSIKQVSNNHQTIITDLNILNKDYVFDTLISFKKNIVLNYNQNFLNLKFSNIGYYQQEKNHYKYKLKGIDDQWVYSGSENAVTYSNLSDGEYTFMVNSTNNHGVWGKTPAVLNITILPPFWKTWWFCLLVSTFLLGGSLLIIRYRERKLIYEKEIAQFRLQALRSQMNPHFIFNALNSIQHFIIKNESSFALTYLSKFAKLVRKILENSTHSRISLDDEIAFLKNYIEIESLRFDNKINFEIILDPEIDSDSIEIPSMLIQPYVENAIIHGLTHNKGQGSIKIEFTKEKQGLKCVILDNGIGRKVSAAINARIAKSHQSLGIPITKNRLEILNKSSESNVVVTIEDVLQKDQTVIGTKVEIYIPID